MGQVDVELTVEEREHPLVGMLPEVVSSMIEFDEVRSQKAMNKHTEPCKIQK